MGSYSMPTRPSKIAADHSGLPYYVSWIIHPSAKYTLPLVQPLYLIWALSADMLKITLSQQAGGVTHMPMSQPTLRKTPSDDTTS